MNLILLPLLIALTCSTYGKVVRFQAVEPQGDPAYMQQTDEGGDVMDRGYLQQTDNGGDAGYVQQTDEGGDPGYMQQTDEGEGYMQQTDEGGDVMDRGYLQQTDDGGDAGYVQQTDEGEGYMQQTDEGKGYMQQTDEGDSYMQQTDEGGDEMDRGYMQQTDERADKMGFDALQDEMANIMQDDDQGDSLDAYKEAARINKIESVTNEAEIQVSKHLFRYVGVGYNQITGSPDGDFNHGGIDPGIRSTNHIFKFTYSGGSSQPNEVRYQPHEACASDSERRAYSGFKSYQSQLSVSVDVEGSYKAYAFTGSAAYNQVKTTSQNHRKIVVEEKKICNYGAILLKDYNGLLKVTNQLTGAVKELPNSYDQTKYVNFINAWGTHMITEAFVGTKWIKRFTSTYADSYKFMQEGTSSSAGVSYDGLVSSGSISLSIDTLSEKVTRSTTFGSRLTEFTIGTRQLPLPISMKMKPIYMALEKKYWPSNIYDSNHIGQKMAALKKAFSVYPSVRGMVAQDPAIVLPVQWPSGRYSLPTGRSGCPAGFVQGCRYQDNEDSSNSNRYTNQGSLIGQFDRNMNFCYCTRLHQDSSVFKWQPGRYCIAKYGDTCSSLGFNHGQLYWDDEDDSNDNRVNGVVPSGRYDHNTRVNYCCRADGNANTPILLPTSKPFVLYQFGSRGCQKVRGMRVKEITIYTDDEDSSNDNGCSNAHPYDTNCGRRDHKVFMCYYYK